MMDNTKKISWPGWEVVKVIGRGSFGTVYEIQREIFGDIEKAALKHISIPNDPSDLDEMYSDGMDEASITEQFQEHLKNIVKEYNLMQELKGSANIVQCEDIRYEQQSDGIGWDIFIKMELLIPLQKALTDNVDEATVEKIAKDICSALVLCQKHKVIHRDIKPQNIFLSPHGDYKLGDFGIAKTVEKTMGGTKIGTYKYMAPEVYNNKPYGASSDIYSLGLVLYWLLNGKRLPFMPPSTEKVKPGMEEEARNRRLCGEALPAPAHGSSKLKAIILKACAYDPADRYRSAEEMLSALNAVEELPRRHILNIKTIGVDTKTDSKDVVNLNINTVKSDIPAEGICYGEALRISVADALKSQYCIEKVTVTRANGDTYLLAPEYKKERGIYEMTMADEDITVIVHLRKTNKKSSKKFLIFAAIVVALVIAIIVGMGGDKPDTKPVNSSSYSSTVKSTPKPTAKPAATKKPVEKTEVEETAKIETKVETKKPSYEDLDAINSKIRYPKDSKYLSKYKYGTIDAPKGDSVNGYYYPEKQGKEDKIYFYPEHGDSVTVLAEQSGRACVIVDSVRKACWINKNYIKYN